MKWSLEFQRDLLIGEMQFIQNEMSNPEMNEFSNRLTIESLYKLDQLNSEP